MPERISRAHRALGRVHELYRLAFEQHAQGREILTALGLTGAGFADAAQIGYAPGTLDTILPDDYGLRKALEAAHVLENGRETLAGCAVVPIFDAQGRVELLAGLSRDGAGPVAGCAPAGLWNWTVLKIHSEVLVTRDLVDALRRVHGGSRGTVALVGQPTQAVRDHFTLWKPARLTAADDTVARLLSDWGLTAAAEPAPEGLTVDLGARRYILSQISREGRRLGVLLRALPRGGGRQFLDGVNLYAARDRARLVRELATLFGVEPAAVEDDLTRLVSVAEQAGRRPTAAVEVGDAERAEATALLSDPALLERILADFERLGIVGERTNKLVGYLVAVSRKLESPLSLLVISRSAAGKSTLAEAIAAMTPPEDLVRLTRLTGQALFYQRSDGLRHKLLIVEEESGVSEAGYPLRVLQSARRLAVATASGSRQVEGPVAVVVTGTRAALDEETRSRFMVVSADESPGQTAAILEAQRKAETLDGLAAQAAREATARLHHNAQRILRPVGVVNPLAPALSFESRRLSARREQPRLLGLIRAVAFLRQYQKRVIDGRYVEVDERDVAIARDLAAAYAVEDLSPPAQRLLAEIQRLGGGPITRRRLRETLGWGNTQLWTGLKELVDFELLAARREGRMGRLAYQTLSDDGPKPSIDAGGPKDA